MKKIEILGPGCPKCNALEESVRQSLAQLAQIAEVVKVTDIKTMIEKGIMMTPGLIVDGKIVLQGKLPAVEEVKNLIKEQGDNHEQFRAGERS